MHLRRQQILSKVTGFWLPAWKTQMELLAADCGLAIVAIWDVKHFMQSKCVCVCVVCVSFCQFFNLTSYKMLTFI